MVNGELLTDDLKNELDILWLNYQDDARRIAARVEKFKHEYLLPRVQGSTEGLPDIDDLADYYRSAQSNPPYLTRIAAKVDLKYIWGQKEIGIILDRNVATVARTLKAMEAPDWAERLNTARIETVRGVKIKRYLYSEDIFHLFLDYYSHEYIANRIISKRYGKNVSPETAESIWKYWYSLCSNTQNWQDFSVLRKSSVIFDDFNMSYTSNKTLRSIFSDCANMLLDHKALSLVLTLVVNFTDISRRTGKYLFYALIIFLLPAFGFIIMKLKASISAEERRQLTKYGAFIMIALAAWGLSFTGRILNGDLSQSVVPAVADQLISRITQIDNAQKHTDAIVADIDKTLSEWTAEELEEDQISTAFADEQTSDARLFVQNAFSDSKKLAPEDYKRVIYNCEMALTRLSNESHLQKANLLLAISNVYVIWGIQNHHLALSKYAAARVSLNKVIEMSRHLSSDIMAEAYTNLGRTYLLEADMRNKAAMLNKAEKCYEHAAPLVSDTPSELNVMYYLGVGVLKTSQSELVIDDTTEKMRLLSNGVEYMEKALALLQDTPEQTSLSHFIFNKLCLARRKLIEVKLVENHNNEDLETFCINTINECGNTLRSLDIEKNQRSFVYLKLQYASLHILLFDIIFDNVYRNNGSEIEDKTYRRCADILKKAYDDIKLALNFNENDEYLNSGHIIAKAAMIKYRMALLLGGDTAVFTDAIKLYDLALQKMPEQNHLQQNMYIAASKAKALLNTGILLNNAEMQQNARDLAQYYLKNYSSTNYYDPINTFKRIIKKMPTD